MFSSRIRWRNLGRASTTSGATSAKDLAADVVFQRLHDVQFQATGKRLQDLNEEKW